MASARSQEDWDPMSDAHKDPHFNSYDEGSGINFQTSGGVVNENNKLYVRNIPPEITEDGLRNVFTSSVGTTPVRVSICASKPQYSTNIAFVNFNTNGEAKRAIINLNKMPPLCLEITYQKTKSELWNTTRRVDNLVPRVESSPQNQSVPPNPSGVIDWEGVRRAGYLDESRREQDRAWSDPSDAFVEPRRAGFYDPHGGASGSVELPQSNDYGLAVNLKISSGVNGRRVSCGRGYFPPEPSEHTTRRKSKEAKSASGPINSLVGPHPSVNATSPRGQQVNSLLGPHPSVNATSPRGQQVNSLLGPHPSVNATSPRGQQVNSLVGPHPSVNGTSPRGQQVNSLVGPHPSVQARATQVSSVQTPPLQVQPMQMKALQTPPVQVQSPKTQSPQAQPMQVESQQVPVAGASAPQPCHECYKPATQVCAICKEVRYCDDVCANKHWVAHKYLCLIHCQAPGSVPIQGLDEPTSSMAKPDVAFSMPSDAKLEAAVPAKHIAPIITERPAQVADVGIPANPAVPSVMERVAQIKQTPALGIGNYEDLPLGKYTPVTVAVPDGAMGWVAVDSRTDHSYEITTAITARKDLAATANPREGDYVAADFCGEWFRARVVKTSPLTVFYLDYGNTEELPPDQIRCLPAEYLKEPGQAVRICVLPSASGTRRTLVSNQQLSVCAVRKEGDVTYVKLQPDDQDSAAKPAAVEIPTPDTLPTATLPAGVFSTVTVVGSAPNGGLWVNLVASASALTDLLARLQNSVAALPPAKNLTVGAIVAVTHMRTIYRAQVTVVGPSSLTVRLVDEGRDIVVDAQKVRPLPADFLGLQAQAIEICGQEGSKQTLSNLLEGVDIIVKPVGKSASSATIVEVSTKPQVALECQKQVQPLSKDKATKVYFISKENEEWYIQCAASSVLVGLMLKEFEALEAASALKPCSKVEVGQVVVTKFEGEWSRCKVLQIANKLEVIFIDYGNKSFVSKEEIWELPEKHTHIPGQCMRVHFTKETPAAIPQLPDFQVFFVTLFAEASNGALIVRGKLVD